MKISERASAALQITVRGGLPAVRRGERPTLYADRLGRWCSEKSGEEHRKGLGQFMTPVAIADFMARMASDPRSGDSVRILDPGAGSGVLSCALCERLASSARRPLRLSVTAYEVDAALAKILEASLAHLKKKLRSQGVDLVYEVKTEDFVLSLAGELREAHSLFGGQSGGARFDVAIANPPYFKLPSTDPRSTATRGLAHGRSNIYALFMAVAARTLATGGEMIFITPRSFASGPYFQRFREEFLAEMRLEAVHVFGSRTEAFQRDEVLQETIVLKARRTGGGLANPNAAVTLSSSAGDADLNRAKPHPVPLGMLVNPGSREKMLRLPVDVRELRAIATMDAWPGSLRSYGLEVSTGPVVPFRAESFLSQEGQPPESFAPLLWMQSIKSMSVEWPARNCTKPQHIARKAREDNLLVPNRNYVLVRRFSAKEDDRRLIAAPLLAASFCHSAIGLENHVNYIHRPGGELTDDEVWGLAALLNSDLFDAYFRALNGNTQVSATELRAMPLPPWDLVEELGCRIKRTSTTSAEIEEAMRLAVCHEGRLVGRTPAHV